MTSERRCIFYRTRAIVDDAASGSDLRPAKMLNAFRELGYRVDVVAGSAAARKRAIENVKRELLAGSQFDFLYAEPPTTPIALSESHHLPTHPLLDYRFLAFCHSHAVPVVLFYSDVHWRLPDYPRSVGWPKYLFMLPFFHLDLLVYRKVVDAFMVPSRGYLDQIAGLVSNRPKWTSMPGFDPAETPAVRAPIAADAPLRLFYVGGISPPAYDLTPLLRGSAHATSRGFHHELTICCREAEWQRRQGEYDRYVTPEVMVVHNRNRQELIELYSRSDIAVMPYGTRYWDWAMPIKFSEAIGMGVPVMAGAGTAVAKVVDEQGIGWSVGSSEDAFSAVLERIDRHELDRVRATIEHVRPGYTWVGRAREVAAVAAGLRAL